MQVINQKSREINYFYWAFDIFQDIFNIFLKGKKVFPV